MNPRLVPTGQETETVEQSGASMLREQWPQAFEQVQGEGLVPIQRVPDDILREIFVQSLPAEVTFNCLESPMLLTHICRHWRTLAWDFSLLWTSLKTTTKQRNTNASLRAELLAAWFERCKGSHVDFQFFFHKASPTQERETPGLAEPYDTHLEFFSRALAHVPAYNFRSLTLYHLPLKLVRSFPRNALPSLESLALSFHYSETFQWTGEEPIRAFEHCTLLRRVAFSGGCLQNPSTAISIPWDQLTHFSFYEEPWGDVFWECVSDMAALEHAHFVLGDDTVGGLRIQQFELQPNRRNNIVLRTLSSLSISFWGAELPTILLPDFWRYFDFPNLQALRFVGEDTDLDSWAAPAEPGSQPIKSIFLNKLGSMKHVTKLSLCFTWLRQTDCALLFDFLPHLIHLGLEGSDRQYYSGIFAALEMGVGRLSGLKTIVFESGNEEQTSKANGIIDVNALYSMVLSRRTCEPENRLERVVLYGSGDWQVTDFQSINKVLKDFVEGGLVVENRHGGDIQMEWWDI